MPKKKKTKRLSVVVNDLAVLLQKLVRLKASDGNGFASCVSCGVRKHWKDLQGGHWIERGKSATKVMEENINPQCAGCNGFGMKYRTLVKDRYSQYMRHFYGDDFCEQMLIDSNLPCKHDRIETEERIKEVRKQIKELEEGI